MNKQLSIAFLGGAFDPEYRKQRYGIKKLRAKLNKPETVTKTVESDWAFNEGKTRKNRKPVTYTMVSSGIMRVASGKFQVQLKRGNKTIHVGTFEVLGDAETARLKAKADLEAGTFMYRGKLFVDPPPKNNRALPKHIYYHDQRKKFYVQRTIKGKKVSYGAYDTLAEAVKRLEQVSVRQE